MIVEVPVEAESPTRIDLSGGTLDLYPLYLLHGRVKVVNISIDIMTRCSITPATELTFEAQDFGRKIAASQAGDDPTFVFHRLVAEVFELKDEPICITTTSMAPIGSGLGGSSSLLISMVTATSRYRGIELTADQIQRLAQNIETSVIAVPTGTQDYIAAQQEGINVIDYQVNHTRTSTPDVSKQFLNQLQDRLYLIYTGQSHHSAQENWTIFKRRIDGNEEIIRLFESIKTISTGVHRAIEREDFDRVKQLVGEEWDQRKQLISTMETETMRLIADRLTHHDIALKACGAGAGGCIILLGPAGLEQEIDDQLADLDCRRLEFKIYSKTPTRSD